MIAATLYSAPMPLGASTAMLDQSREGRELWRIGQMSTHELLCRTFENDRVRMHFARVAAENLVAPDEKGTGIGVYIFLGFLEAYGFGVPVGGSGSLTTRSSGASRRTAAGCSPGLTLTRCSPAPGGNRRAQPRRPRVRRPGGVIAAIHPHHLGRLVQGIDPGIAADAAATEISANACITVHAALREPLRTVHGEPLRSVMTELLPTRYEQLRRSFDDLRYGQLSSYPLIGLGSLSEFDSSRVPAGQATMHAWDYVPYERADGRSWDETKAEYAQRMLTHMSRFLPNLTPENLIAWHCDSPLDMERTSSSFVRGDLHGIAMPSYQLGAHRPTPELGQFVVPGTAGLYLVGPFQHPGGGVFGAGRATAQRLCEDLKIDFAKIPRRALAGASAGGRDAAVDVQDLPIDERGGRAEQEHRRRGDVVLVAEPAQRDGARAALVFGRIVQAHGPRGGHRPGCQCVDADAARAEFGGQRLGEGGEGALHRAVERGVRIAALGHRGAHVDDRGGTVRFHVGQQCWLPQIAPLMPIPSI